MRDHLIPTSISSPPLLPNNDISNEVIHFIEETGSSKINLLKDLLESITKIGQKEIHNINDSIELWKLPCSFIRKAGDTIHLYERSDGSKFWSIISPQEWKNELIFHGSYKILYDQIMERL